MLTVHVDSVMAQNVTYSIVDQPDGRFALVVLLGSCLLYTRSGLRTLAEVEEQIALVRDLIAACGAPVMELQDGRCPPNLLHPFGNIPQE